MDSVLTNVPALTTIRAHAEPTSRILIDVRLVEGSHRGMQPNIVNPTANEYREFIKRWSYTFRYVGFHPLSLEHVDRAQLHRRPVPDVWNAATAANDGRMLGEANNIENKSQVLCLFGGDLSFVMPKPCGTENGVALMTRDVQKPSFPTDRALPFWLVHSCHRFRIPDPASYRLTKRMALSHWKCQRESALDLLQQLPHCSTPWTSDSTPPLLFLILTH
ncbi:hypothetical protein EDD15DRAFT_557874 [Pisolithus albus]|nr:hypothetical protein EDD15DRAFT_557874 [Pisolithus albus]